MSSASPKRSDIRTGGGEFAVYEPAGSAPAGAPQLIWAHGWGHSHQALLPLALAMRQTARSWLVDLPGFGASPTPPAAWGTADYADAMAEWIATLPGRRPEARPGGIKVWVGHSFGCRVGLQLAARHPGAVDALCLISTAGLPPHRSLAALARRWPRRTAFRVLRALTPEGPARDRLRERYGSSDYRNAGPMRPVLVRAVNEDLSDVARAVRIPVVLVHGEDDRESPPEISERLHRLIPDSRLALLRGFDHWTILDEGRHQVVHLLSELLGELR
jgi:pimeloyl-ACP methyl ester carboxylesterase